MGDLLLPRTDAGVLVQVVLTAAIGGPLVWLLSRRQAPELTWFVGGLVVLLMGCFALRSVL